MGIIAQVVGLQELIDDTAFRNIEAEELGFSKTGAGKEFVFSNIIAVDRVILAQGTLVNPAIGKDEVVFRYPAGAFKTFPRL